MGIDTKSFIEKSEFINALLDARNERKARCADCDKEEGGGVSLKACKSCMLVKYCNADCQKNHWPTHKQICKHRAAELRDEALFKDPPAKEDCPICFLPMPMRIISCIPLPPATVLSVPIRDYAMANERLASLDTEQYYTCCGKSICGGCIHSFYLSGNHDKCPFCKADGRDKTDEENIQELMKRVEANDAASIDVLGNNYYHGRVCCKIVQRQWNYGNRLRNLGPVRHISALVSIMKKENQRKPNSTTRQRLC
jgi:hypothetical protein